MINVERPPIAINLLLPSGWKYIPTVATNTNKPQIYVGAVQSRNMVTFARNKEAKFWLHNTWTKIKECDKATDK